MTGLDFIELMSKRGCKGHPSNKIILSGNTSEIDMERVRQVGCQVIQKPVSLEQVDQFVAQCRERIKPTRELADLSKKT